MPRFEFEVASFEFPRPPRGKCVRMAGIAFRLFNSKLETRNYKLIMDNAITVGNLSKRFGPFKAAVGR